MIYVFIKRDDERNRNYIDVPREFRTNKAVRQVHKLGEDAYDMLQSCHDGVYQIEGAKSADDPDLATILRGFSASNPGCSIELLETKMIAQSPPGECVIQQVTKNGVLPV